VRAGLVVFVLLSRRSQTPGDGRLAAVSERTGRVLWSRTIPAGSESSPLVWGGSVYFGDQSGAVYSLAARTGRVNWVYHARGAVKGGVAQANGILYFGDYAGRVYALHARSGRVLWDVGTNGSAFGFGSGNFYSTPAVAFGRVYLGNTDGFVYSFAARSGQLAWAHETGAYVYASPAVGDLRGIGPTVYIGSYDGRFYAFDAASGAVRWAHPAGGRISGAATIVGDVVYYSDLGTRTTTGLSARTGRVVFSFHDGAFNPVIADEHAIYLDGYNTLYELLPRHRAASGRRATSPRGASGAAKRSRNRAARSRSAHVSRRRIRR
jgi:outer membrane protein assembly factor BamB